MSSTTPIRLLPPVVAGGNKEEVVGAVIEEAEDDNAGGGDDDVVPVVVSVGAAAPFCVKSIVRRTGWHISSAAAASTTIADAHKSKLLTLAGIVVLIGSMIGASFPRTTVTSMPIFLGGFVPGGVAVVVPLPPAAPSFPILNVNVSGLVLPPVIVALWSGVVDVVPAPVC